MYFIPDDRPTGPDNRPAGLETARDFSFGIPRGPLLARLSTHIAAGIRCLVVLVVGLRFALGGRTACRPLTVNARDAFESIRSTPFVLQIISSSTRKRNVENGSNLPPRMQNARAV